MPFCFIICEGAAASLFSLFLVLFLRRTVLFRKTQRCMNGELFFSSSFHVRCHALLAIYTGLLFVFFHLISMFSIFVGKNLSKSMNRTNKSTNAEMCFLRGLQKSWNCQSSFLLIEAIVFRGLTKSAPGPTGARANVSKVSIIFKYQLIGVVLGLASGLHIFQAIIEFFSVAKKIC